MSVYSTIVKIIVQEKMSFNRQDVMVYHGNNG